MKKSTLVILIVVIIGLFIVPVIMLNTKKEPPVNSKLFTRTVPGELMDLFTDATRKQLTIIGTKKTASGLPVSSLIYTYNGMEGVRGYIVELFKVDLKDGKPLSQIIQLKRGVVKEKSDTGFIKLREGGFDLKYKDGRPDSISKINWNFDGDLLKLNTQTDSLLYYDVKFKHFGLKYDNGSEFTADETGLFSGQQTGKFIFLKKKNTLYTIFLSNPDIPELKRDTVLSLLNGKLPR